MPTTGHMSPRAVATLRHETDSRPVLVSPRTGGRTTSHALDYLPIVLFLVCYVAANHYWNVPFWVAILYLTASIVTLAVYAIDKARARRGARRVSESTLNLLAFVGGWPGAIIAQQTLRHKTIKASFRRKFWMAVVANILLFIAIASPWVRDLLGATGH